MFSTKSHTFYKRLPAGFGLKTLGLLALVCLSLLVMQSIDLLGDLAIGDPVSLAVITGTKIFEAGLYSLPSLASPSPIARAPPAQA